MRVAPPRDDGRHDYRLLLDLDGADAERLEHHAPGVCGAGRGGLERRGRSTSIVVLTAWEMLWRGPGCRWVRMTS